MEVFSATKLANDGTNLAKQLPDESIKKVQESDSQDAKKENDEKSKEVEKDKVNDFVKKMNEDLGKLEQNLEFSYNEDIEQMMITVTKKDSGEVVRTIPTEEAIEISKKMKDIVGALFDKKG
jgi:flagellar protein FlaG